MCDSKHSLSHHVSFLFCSAPSDGAANAHKPETLADDEWSEAWAEYRRECKEEDDEARAKGITDEDVKNQTAPDVPQEAPKPLSAGHRCSLKFEHARCCLDSGLNFSLPCCFAI
jgi:hypothetical protein